MTKPIHSGNNPLLPTARSVAGERTSAEFDSYYNSARVELLNLLGEFLPTRALELGCGAAANLALLKHRFPACHTVGIERDPHAAAIATNASAADEIFLGDAMAEAIDFAPDSFDVVILSHVLEHFEDPALLLQRVLQWTRPQARVLVALPNIRHYSVLYELVVRGDFRYQPHGILDQTHLRFFTRLSATRFLTSQGLEVQACRPEISGRLARLISEASFGMANEFAAFAYNFCLRRAIPCAS